MEARLVLAEVIEVDQAVRPVTLGSTVIAVQLAATDALSARLFFPGELEGFEVGTDVRAVTPGLLLAVSTGAPEVGFALLHVNLVAALLWHVGQR